MPTKYITVCELAELRKQLPYSLITFTIKSGKEKVVKTATITELKVLFEDREYTFVYGENGYEYDGPIDLR